MQHHRTTHNHRSAHRKIQAAPAVENLAASAKQRMAHLRKGVKVTRKAVQSMNRYSHRNPWLIVGAFSLVSGLMGFVFGTRRNSYY